MLICHYLKIAFRNLRKYKLQSIISIIGLAVGFACFTLSTLWIRHELTFDTFHAGAGQIFFVCSKSDTDNSGITRITPYLLSGYLKKTFPEIEASCTMQAWPTGYKFRKMDRQSFMMCIDSAAFSMFRLRLLAGNKNFMLTRSKEIAINDKIAKELYGPESPIGEEIEIDGEKRKICAVVQGWNEHSNLPFEIVGSLYIREEWNSSCYQTFIKVKKGIDIKSFEKKLFEHEIKSNDYTYKNILLFPITAMHYKQPITETTVRLEHILLFALAGGLVILCALFNYLTLFTNRIRIRAKEIGLRKVCGSSNGHLLLLFSAEYFLTLLLALLCGMILIELAIPYFKNISGIRTTVSGIYAEVLAYSSIMILLSFVFSSLLILSFRKQSLNTILRGSKNIKGKNMFSSVSLAVQLIISIGFIFCSSMLIKQIHFLNTTDMGFDRTGRGSVATYPGTDGLKDELSRIPCITEVFPDSFMAMFPRGGRAFYSYNDWDEKPASIENITMELIDCNKAYFDFYQLHLLKGKLPSDHSSVLINETAAKAMGLNDPVDKTIKWGSSPIRIAGVVKDFYLAPPTIPTKPIMLDFRPNDNTTNEILFKYQGDWNKCRRQIEQLIQKLNPGLIFTNLYSLEEEYQKFWKSESMLLKMLDFVTLICVLISLFGVFSQVTLDCEQYRKEIAVRKINGASVRSIIRMFFRKYLGLLCLASVLTFPVVYFIMRSWIENYVLQTSISWWLYPLIWSGLAILLSLCTFWRISRAANQNPAEIVKSE